MNLVQPAQYYTLFSKSGTRLVLFSNLENSHQTCSIKKAALRNFKIFAGKLCRSVSLLKLQGFRLSSLKSDSDTDVFLWILRNFLENLFWRTSADDCFCIPRMNETVSIVTNQILSYIIVSQYLAWKVPSLQYFEFWAQ